MGYHHGTYADEEEEDEEDVEHGQDSHRERRQDVLERAAAHYIILNYIILYYIILYIFATNITLNGHEYYFESHCSVDRQVVLERAAAKYNNIIHYNKAKYNNMINKNIKARREGRVRYHENILKYILLY